MAEHAKKVDDEGTFVKDGDDAVAEAERLHHLATADPEPERDGVLVSKQHEEKYGLERASDASVGVDTRGYVERTAPIEDTSAPRASKK